MALQFEVDSKSPLVAAMSQPWPMIDALVAGSGAMRAAGEQFLPKFPSEHEDSYKARLKSAVLFPAFSRTTAVMAAKPFSRPMTIGDNTPAEVQDLFEDIDRYRTDLQPFMAQVMVNCLQYGLMGVLVDSPKRGRGIKTKAQEKAAGIRPYLTQYTASSILGWRVAEGGDGAILAQLRLLEVVKEDDGPWGQKEVRQVRVLEPGRWSVWRQRTSSVGALEWFMFEEGRTSLKKVPFVFFYGIKAGFGVGKPPLLDLAYQNVEHWQSSSDQQNILHVARVPILFAKGFGDSDNLVVGAASAARSTNKDSDLKFVEHSGAAIEAGRQSVLDLEDRMRQTGAELLIQRPSVTTATQISSDNEGNRSTLQQIAEDFEESIEECLELLGEFMGQKFDAEVELYKDFGSANLSEKSGDLLLRAADSDHVSPETVHTQLKRMDIIPADTKWEDEIPRIDAKRAARAKEQQAKSSPGPA